jgi:hypothetical protein
MFHRLTPPAYFIPGGGPLPTGYDYLNDPIAGGSGGGIAAPADAGAKSGGTYDGTYFVGEDAEEVNAFNTNRLGSALGTNTDFIDDILNADQAIVFFDQVSSGHGGLASHAINGSTNGLWLSDSGGTAFTDLFAVTDLNGDPLIVGGTIVAVTSLTGAAVGAGFVQTNPVTANFNKTIPDQQGFRVYYGIQASYARAANDAFFKPGIRRTHNVRGIVAAISDNVSSTDGDHNSATLDSIVKSSLAFRDSGLYYLNPGIYQLTAATTSWDKKVRLTGDTARINVAAGYAGDLAIAAKTCIEGVTLGSLSTSGLYSITAAFSYDGRGRDANLVEFGALKINVSGTTPVSIRGAVGTGNATLTAVTAGLLVTNAGIIHLSDLDFTTGAPTASGSYAAALKIDTFDGTLLVENCKFYGNVAGASGLSLANAFGNIRFINCEFNAVTAGAGLGVTASGCNGVTFENCLIKATSGQAAKLVNAGCHFVDCTFTAGTDTSVTNPQLIAGEGFIGAGSHQPMPLAFTRCLAVVTAANVRATGAPTKPIIELGGHDAAIHDGEVVTKGLIVTMSTASIGVHNYSTVLLHSGSFFANTNIFDDLSIDMRQNVPAASGTLAAFLGSFEGKGFVLEAVSAQDHPHMVINNLHLLNVGAPASAIARSVAGFLNCDVNGLVIDGSGAGAGSYSKVLVEAQVSDLRNVRYFPSAALKTTGTIALMGKLISSEIRGLRYHHRAIGGALSAQLFNIQIDSKISDALILINSALTGGFAVIGINGARAAFRGSTIFLTSSTDGPLILGVQNEMDVSGNTFTWQNSSGSATLVIATLVPTNGTVIGNRFVTTSTDAPVPSYIPSDSIPVTLTDLNVVMTGANSTAPTVY